MKVRWLFNTNDSTWHVWPPSDEAPAEGEQAYCGLECDGNCTVTGDSNVKCVDCITATQAEEP